MKNIEEYQNLVALLKTTLEFYADDTNYAEYMGNPATIALDAYGSQARFALSKIKEVETQSQKLLEDYEKLVADSEFMESGETSPIELIKHFNLTHDDKNV